MIVMINGTGCGSGYHLERSWSPQNPVVFFRALLGGKVGRKRGEPGLGGGSRAEQTESREGTDYTERQHREGRGPHPFFLRWVCSHLHLLMTYDESPTS